MSATASIPATDAASVKWHPLTQTDPNTLWKESDKYANVWKVAAIATFVAYGCLAVLVTAVAVSKSILFAPVVITLLLTVSIPSAHLIIEKMWNKAVAYAQEATLNHRIVEKCNSLPTDPQGLRKILEDNGLDTTSLQDSELLAERNLIGTYLISNEDVVNTLRKVQEERAAKEIEIRVNGTFKKVDRSKYTDLNNLDPAFKEQEMQTLTSVMVHESKLQNMELDALKSKVSTAFLLYVLQNPHSEQSMDKFCSISHASSMVRDVLKAHNAPHADLLVKTQKTSLNISNVKDNSNAEIAADLFGVKLRTSA